MYIYLYIYTHIYIYSAVITYILLLYIVYLVIFYYMTYIYIYIIFIYNLYAYIKKLNSSLSSTLYATCVCPQRCSSRQQRPFDFPQRPSKFVLRFSSNTLVNANQLCKVTDLRNTNMYWPSTKLYASLGFLLIWCFFFTYMCNLA